MTEWPAYVSQAAYETGYDEDEPSDYAAIEGFFAHWGGWGPEAIVRGYLDGDARERHFAMHLLTDAAFPHARSAALASLARAGVANEEVGLRGHAAVYLGALGDVQAAPALAQLLTDALPTPERYYTERLQQSHVEGLRRSAAYLLGVLGVVDSIPPLRTALRAVLQIERVLPDSVDTVERASWRYTNAEATVQGYADTIVYALGRLGAFGALTGIPLTPVRETYWPLHLTLGALHGRYPMTEIMRFADKQLLLTDVTHHLMVFFGFTPEEVHASLSEYERNHLFSLFALYEGEADASLMRRSAGR